MEDPIDFPNLKQLFGGDDDEDAILGIPLSRQPDQQISVESGYAGSTEGTPKTPPMPAQLEPGTWSAVNPPLKIKLADLFPTADWAQEAEECTAPPNSPHDLINTAVAQQLLSYNSQASYAESTTALSQFSFQTCNSGSPPPQPMPFAVGDRKDLHRSPLLAPARPTSLAIGTFGPEIAVSGLPKFGSFKKPLSPPSASAEDGPQPKFSGAITELRQKPAKIPRWEAETTRPVAQQPWLRHGGETCWLIRGKPAHFPVIPEWMPLLELESSEFTRYGWSRPPKRAKKPILSIRLQCQPEDPGWIRRIHIPALPRLLGMPVAESSQFPCLGTTPVSAAFDAYFGTEPSRERIAAVETARVEAHLKHKLPGPKMRTALLAQVLESYITVNRPMWGTLAAHFHRPEASFTVAQMTTEVVRHVHSCISEGEGRTAMEELAEYFSKVDAGHMDTA